MIRNRPRPDTVRDVQPAGTTAIISLQRTSGCKYFRVNPVSIMVWLLGASGFRASSGTTGLV